MFMASGFNFYSSFQISRIIILDIRNKRPFSAIILDIQNNYFGYPQ